MPLRTIEHLQKNTIDGENTLLSRKEQYTGDAVLFLFYDPQNGFLFEKRIHPNKALFGKIIIPGGKIKDSYEKQNPMSAVQRECREEIGIVSNHIVPLPVYFDTKQRWQLYPFFMIGILWGKLVNKEPKKMEFVWITPDEIHHNGQFHPSITLISTQQILLNAIKTVNSYSL